MCGGRGLGHCWGDLFHINESRPLLTVCGGASRSWFTTNSCASGTDHGTTSRPAVDVCFVLSHCCPCPSSAGKSSCPCLVSVSGRRRCDADGRGHEPELGLEEAPICKAAARRIRPPQTWKISCNSVLKAPRCWYRVTGTTSSRYIGSLQDRLPIIPSGHHIGLLHSNPTILLHVPSRIRIHRPAQNDERDARASVSTSSTHQKRLTIQHRHRRRSNTHRWDSHPCRASTSFTVLTSKPLNSSGTT